MKVYSLYFSPTGGTKKIMDALMTDWKPEAELDLSEPEKRYDVYRFVRGDVCVIGMPSFGGRVPETALNRLKQMKADQAAAILVVAYGNRDYEDSLLELRKAAEQCGFRVIGAVAAVAEHSILHQFAAGRPDAQDTKLLREFAGKLQDKLYKPDTWKDFFVPGRYPYKEYKGNPMKPATQKECGACGLCAKQCPVQAIQMDPVAKTDESRCISCMRCVSICPKKARTLSKTAVFAASLKLRKACSERKEAELFL